MGSPPRRRNPALPPSLLSLVFPTFHSCCFFLMSKSPALEGVQGQIQKCAASILISSPQNQPSSHPSNKCCTERELEMSPAPPLNAAISNKRILAVNWFIHTRLYLARELSLERVYLEENANPVRPTSFLLSTFKAVYWLLREIKVITSAS